MCLPINWSAHTGNSQSAFHTSDEFYSLVVSAFQTAVDATFAQQPHTEQAERKLLSAMAALKREFGLTDRYQVEAWRPGRE